MTDRMTPGAPESSPPEERSGGWRKLRLHGRDVVIAAVVAAMTIVFQTVIDDRREDKADRRENLRFLREQVAAGTLPKVPVRHLDLSDQNLSGLDLRNVPLHAVILAGADLSHTVIVNAEFYEADLSAADISEASLKNAALNRANLRGANLKGTYFIDSSVSDANFTRANLKDTYFGYSTGIETLSDVNFTGADLRSSDLSRVRLDGVKLYGADLREAYLDESLYHVVCYDFRTRWPKNFQPPESADPNKCRPE